ncbi:MAG: PAS domain S-box protein [Desulfobacterales bacterium]
MGKLLDTLRDRLATKLIVSVGIVLALSLTAWTWFNIHNQREKLIHNVTQDIDRLSNTIKLGTHYAMMLNSRPDITQIINNIAQQKEIKAIRIYNKSGEIKFSNKTEEINRETAITDEACHICHRRDPPRQHLTLDQRTRMVKRSNGPRLMGIVSPIRNEPDCTTAACHFHREEQTVLGVLDVVVSLENTDKFILTLEKYTIGFTVILFIAIALIIWLLVMRFVNQPIQKLIRGTRLIAKGDYHSKVDIRQSDEMGKLARAVNQMANEIDRKQGEVNKQKQEYQKLFEQVPCFITVVDRNFRLNQFNTEFAKHFEPKFNDYCYFAYKGRNEKCEYCPVEKTFNDGKPHFGEETGIDKYGETKHWIVRTAPITNEKGEVIAAMEMCLDITPRKRLEEQLKTSEEKYYAIFNNIPNPVFVLDNNTLEILDSNESAEALYGYTKSELISRPFTALFNENEVEYYQDKIHSSAVINKVKQFHKNGDRLYVNIRVSPSEFAGIKVYLITTSDITQRLETEQQLVQASKMATLGEMATGIAHELNQPLSVIKTASGFLMKKQQSGAELAASTFQSMLEKIDSNIDRATKIINHMRDIARKSDLQLQPMQIQDVITKAYEMFQQQLKLREILVEWDLPEDLPTINGDPDRLEQVFINLFVNARDAIEEKWGGMDYSEGDKLIRISGRTENRSVIIEFSDTGPGIPKNMTDRIFEPFFTTKEAGKGTGLGLSISYGIIRDCGGDISVAPSEAGARFILKFPVRQANEESADFNR